MTEPRTANFWEALKSAAVFPGQKWTRLGNDGVIIKSIYCDWVGDICDEGNRANFTKEDIFATWTCET